MPSATSWEKKDILKVNEVIDLNFDLLGYIAPQITVNVITDGVITKKIHPKLPETISGVLKCKNPRCITSIEQELEHVFKLTDPENGVYRCIYCDIKSGISVRCVGKTIFATLSNETPLYKRKGQNL